MPADLGDRDAEIDRRIEDARAVEMQTQPFRGGELRGPREVVERQYFASLGILQAQQAGLGEITSSWEQAFGSLSSYGLSSYSLSSEQLSSWNLASWSGLEFGLSSWNELISESSLFSGIGASW